MKKLALYKCFNPRTHTGCDPRTARDPSSPASFNPRTHTGCDHDPFSKEDEFYVSIHAPTRGATTPLLRYFPRGLFQSTHPHGVRLYRPQYPVAGYGFQSTHPHGVRLHILFFLTIIIMFQSTHPHGVRHYHIM